MEAISQGWNQSPLENSPRDLTPTDDQRLPTTAKDHHGILVAITLTVAVSAHRIVLNNPMGGMAYGHAHGGYCNMRKFKLTIEYIIGYFIARCTCDTASHHIYLIVVAKKAPIRQLQLCGAANH